MSENKSISLEKNSFRTFMAVLGLIKESCSSMTIKEGYIRQLSDKKDVIFNIDMSSIIGTDVDIILTGLKTKFYLLDMFNKQGRDVDIQILKNVYIFHDSYSKIQFSMPKEEYVENKFIKEKDFNNKIKLNNDNLIFEAEFPEFILKRFTSYSKSLECEKIFVDFLEKENKIDFKLLYQDNNNSTMIKLQTVEEVDCSTYKGTAEISNVPFLMESPGIEIKFHSRDGVSNGLVIDVKSTIGVDPVIPVNLVCLANIQERRKDG